MRNKQYVHNINSATSFHSSKTRDQGCSKLFQKIITAFPWGLTSLKERLCSPKRINLWKSFKQPLTHSFWRAQPLYYYRQVVKFPKLVQDLRSEFQQKNCHHGCVLFPSLSRLAPCLNYSRVVKQIVVFLLESLALVDIFQVHGIAFWLANNWCAKCKLDVYYKISANMEVENFSCCVWEIFVE